MWPSQKLQDFFKKILFFLGWGRGVVGSEGTFVPGSLFWTWGSGVQCEPTFTSYAFKKKERKGTNVCFGHPRV